MVVLKVGFEITVYVNGLGYRQHIVPVNSKCDALKRINRAYVGQDFEIVDVKRRLPRSPQRPRRRRAWPPEQ